MHEHGDGPALRRRSRRLERDQHRDVDARIDPDTLVRKRFEKFRSIGSVR